MRKFIAERVTTKTELEILAGDRARIWIQVEVDQQIHRYVLTSGPEGDVRDYFDGKITLAELRRRWGMPLSGESCQPSP